MPKKKFKTISVGEDNLIPTMVNPLFLSCQEKVADKRFNFSELLMPQSDVRDWMLQKMHEAKGDAINFWRSIGSPAALYPHKVIYPGGERIVLYSSKYDIVVDPNSAVRIFGWGKSSGFTQINRMKPSEV